MNTLKAFNNYSDFVTIRRDIHAHPELGFEEHRTSAKVADLLRQWGLEVHTGLAGTGVVGTLRFGTQKNAIGLRADLDALPLLEKNQFAHRSKHEGRMHACGHDGHTTMLLAAAWYWATQATEHEKAGCNGNIHFIFQPAEEMGKAGAKVMIDEGLFTKFPCDAVFGIHNWPLAKEGTFALNHGALMASSNTWKITLHGQGYHASEPHGAKDPVAATIDVAQQLQTLLPKVIHSKERAVLAVTQIEGSNAPNIIPDVAWVGGTLRTFSVTALDAIEAAMRRLAEHIALAHGCRAEFYFRRASPPLINHAAEASFAADAMRAVVGNDAVNEHFDAVMGAEDFAHMLLSRPGCYAFLGNGDGTHRLPGHGEGPCMVHNPSYDFNDALIPIGASYFVELAKRWMCR